MGGTPDYIDPPEAPPDYAMCFYLIHACTQLSDAAVIYPTGSEYRSEEREIEAYHLSLKDIAQLTEHGFKITRIAPKSNELISVFMSVPDKVRNATEADLDAEGVY